MRIVLVLVLAACLAIGATFAQTKLDDGPSQTRDTRSKLEVTMKFLQDTLNSVGLVTYISRGHDSKTGQDWTNRFTDQASGVVAVPEACHIYYHWKTTYDGIAAMDKAVGFALKDVQKVDVLTRLQYFNEDNIAMGHSSWSAQVDPAVFVVRVQRPAKVENQFSFLDESLANRVAKALAEAVGLCGGGGKAGSQPAH